MKNELVYPFQNYDIKQIKYIAERIEYTRYYHNLLYSLSIDNINFDKLTLSEKGILAYIKFLNEEIKICSDYVYLNKIITGIETKIKYMISIGERPFPPDILTVFKQDSSIIKHIDILNVVIELYLNMYGYKTIKGNIEDIFETKKLSNIEDVANNLLYNYGYSEKIKKIG